MGTNYYLRINGETYHLGKSSGGWKFSLNIIRILKAIIDNLDIEEIKMVKEVYSLVNNSANLNYENNKLGLHNEGIPDVINTHKWLLNYSDIFIGDNTHRIQKSVYVQINISVITQKQFTSWLRQLLEIEGSYIYDENYDNDEDRWNINKFIDMINDVEGLDLISYARKQEPRSHWITLSVEYKIGNLRCSSHEDFD